jgi:hypothetical protein
MGPGAVFAILFLVLLALLIPAGPGGTQVLTSMLIGLLLSGVISFIGWMSAGRAAARERARRAAGDEQQAPPPAEPPAPAPEGGAA